MKEQKKDKRKVYDSERLEIDDKFVATFDGKGDPETKTLKVYRYHGDINRSKEALQIFCADHGYDTLKVNFSLY